MESPIVVHGVPFAEEPRPGQGKVYDFAVDLHLARLNVQLPTGYGKTRVACGLYSILRRQGRANRLLYIVSTQQQRDQFRLDGPSEFAGVGIPTIKQVVDISYDHVLALQKHRQGKAEIFLTTVQSIMERRSGRAAVLDMMATGLWMAVIDEMHHYGDGKAFADAVVNLPFVLTLAMSATPHRKTRDGIFGNLDVVVEYEKAYKEGAVKKLSLHSYAYRVETVAPDGEITSYTTDELAKAFGLTVGAGGELTGLDKAIIARNLRWSPKYVSPLVDKPIQRALETELSSGIPAQVLIKVMSISHAKLVHSQISFMYKDTPIVVEWVGTGDDGRTDEDNAAILRGFCPPKREDGKRHPDDVKVNVLIAVGLAGEGMDSTYVTEIVFLTPANDTNQNRQTIGRGSRTISGVAEQPICHVNVDSSSTLAKYTGKAIMSLLDMPVGEEPEYDPDDDDDDDESKPLPPDPIFLVLDAELIRVDESDVRLAGAYMQQMKLIDYGVSSNDWSMISTDDPRFRHALAGLRAARTHEAEEMNEQSIVERWHNVVKKATQKTAGAAITLLRRQGFSIDGKLAGDLKQRINAQKLREVCPLSKDVQVLQRHYKWLVALDAYLREGKLPSWLV